MNNTEKRHYKSSMITDVPMFSFGAPIWQYFISSLVVAEGLVQGITIGTLILFQRTIKGSHVNKYLHFAIDSVN